MKSRAKSTETKSSGIFLTEIPVHVDPSDIHEWVSLSPEHRDQSYSDQSHTPHRFLFTKKHIGLKECFSDRKKKNKIYKLRMIVWKNNQYSPYQAVTLNAHDMHYMIPFTDCELLEGTVDSLL